MSTWMRENKAVVLFSTLSLCLLISMALSVAALYMALGNKATLHTKDLIVRGNTQVGDLDIKGTISGTQSTDAKINATVVRFRNQIQSDKGIAVGTGDSHYALPDSISDAKVGYQLSLGPDNKVSFTEPGTVAIASHAEAIASHTRYLESHNTALASQGTSIAANTATLASHATSLASHTTALASHETSLTSNATTLASHATSLASHTTTLASQGQSLASHTTLMSAIQNTLAVANWPDKLDNAVKLNGTLLQIPTNQLGTNAPGNKYCIMMWVWVDTDWTASDTGLFYKQNSTTNEILSGLFLGKSLTSFQYDGVPSGQRTTINVTSPLKVNAWNHVAFENAAWAGRVRLWVNGELTTLSGVSQAVYSDTRNADVMVGAPQKSMVTDLRIYGATDTLNSFELAIHNTNLVATVYNGGLGYSVDTGHRNDVLSVGYFPFTSSSTVNQAQPTTVMPQPAPSNMVVSSTVQRVRVNRVGLSVYDF